MFFIFSKILGFLINPIVWIACILLYAIIIKNPIKRKRAVLVSFVLLLVFSNAFIFDEVMRQWEIPAIAQNSMRKPYKVGIVLGGGSYYDKELKRIQFARGADRIFQGLELYKKGYIQKLFISGGSSSLGKAEVKEAFTIKKYLLTIGIPETAIIIEPESRNTRENALFSAQKLDSAGYAKNETHLLITSAIHMRRALKCFEKAGISTEPYSTDRYSGPRKFEWEHVFIPNAETLLNWNTLLHEMIGYVVYKIMLYC